MNEKIYKAMGSSAVSSLVIGICVLATGIAAGVLLIIILQIRRIFSFSGFFTLYCQPVRSPSLTFHFFHAKVNAYC